jgi:hypothetical protein
MKNSIAFGLACTFLSGCMPVIERSVLFRPIYVPHTGTLWLIEKQIRPSQSEELAVIVCHRDATPACIRVLPVDARDGGDYSRWLGTMPREIRELAAQSPTFPPASLAPESAACLPPPVQSPPATRAPDNPY